MGRKYDILASCIGSLLKLEAYLVLEIGGGKKERKNKIPEQAFQKDSCILCAL